MLLLRGAAPRLLAVALLLVGLVSMHAVEQAAGTHGADHGARTTTASSFTAPTTVIAPTVTTTVATTTPGPPPAPAPAPCHDGAGSEAACSSTTAHSAVAQEAVASPPGSLLLPLTALPQRPAPRAAAQPPAPVSRVILRT